MAAGNVTCELSQCALGEPISTSGMEHCILEVYIDIACLSKIKSGP